MKKKYLLFVIFAFFGLLLTSCMKKESHVSKMNKGLYTGDLTTVLLQDTTTYAVTAVGPLATNYESYFNFQVLISGQIYSYRIGFNDEGLSDTLVLNQYDWTLSQTDTTVSVPEPSQLYTDSMLLTKSSLKCYFHSIGSISGDTTFSYLYLTH